MSLPAPPLGGEAAAGCIPSPCISLSLQQVVLEPLDGPNEGIFWLTLCRPDARNAIGRQFLRELRECLATVAQVRPTSVAMAMCPRLHLSMHG